ncbi:MAG: hypothetical protein CL917_10970 [Deltaproteobacteria bacterium]|nr:hypothetical protein [Deltaproteobacteria bacterium]
MTWAFALLWFLMLPGIGCFFLKQRDCPVVYQLLAGWVLGSAIVGFIFLVISQLGMLANLQVFGFTGLLLVMGILGWRRVLSNSTPSIWTHGQNYWNSLDGWNRTWLGIIFVITLILFFDALTPPRAGDAMRYHLAQMEDLVRNNGFVFRPYYHYNFPLYYSYLSTPVYFVSGGAGVKLFNFYVLGVVAALTYGLGRISGLKRPLLPVLGILLTPGIFRAATTPNNDLGVLAFGLAGILLLQGFLRVRKESLIFLAYVSLGFAVGIKYQSILFLPWYLWLTWVALNRKIDRSALRRLIAWGCICIAIPAPFFLRNYLNTGVPDFPMHLDLFGAPKDFLYESMNHYSLSLVGEHDIRTTWRAVSRLVTSKVTIPTMWLFFALGVYAFFRKGRDAAGLYLLFGIISQLILWWVIQPRLYGRFVNYMVPQVMVVAFLGFQFIDGERLRRLAIAVGVASAAIASAILIFYSIGFMQYHIDGDVDRYHEFTWFYDEYQWMDENLSEDAKVLIVVWSGHTYYMPREYLRADPSHSGLIDWRQLDSQELYDLMEELELEYVFYQDRDWGDSVGGREMSSVMNRFALREDVETVWRRDIQLGKSRMMGQMLDANVWLLRRISNHETEEADPIETGSGIGPRSEGESLTSQ